MNLKNAIYWRFFETWFLANVTEVEDSGHVALIIIDHIQIINLNLFWLCDEILVEAINIEI